MSQVRIGEMEVMSAGGTCAVCKGKIEKGIAVQLSAQTSRIRHLTCLPKNDTRAGVGIMRRRASRRMVDKD
jgi:hypothetical protein